MAKIFHALDRIKPVYDIAEKVMMFICKILLIADILVTCYIVLGRTGGSDPDGVHGRAFRYAGYPQQRPHPHDLL